MIPRNFKARLVRAFFIGENRLLTLLSPDFTGGFYLRLSDDSLAESQSTSRLSR
jgi:hypothetical protein